MQIGFEIQIQDVTDGRMGRGMEIREWGLRSTLHISLYLETVLCKKAHPFCLRSRFNSKILQ